MERSKRIEKRAEATLHMYDQGIYKEIEEQQQRLQRNSLTLSDFFGEWIKLKSFLKDFDNDISSEINQETGTKRVTII